MSDSTRFLPRLTLPLAPLLHPGETSARPSKRLRPEDVLDLEETHRQLAPSILTTVDINGNPWSVVSVFSPYSPDIHVMIMETSTGRLLPGPESVPDDEGDALMPLWRFVLNHIGSRSGNDSLYVGYNWSPRAWGEREERGGFQSVPTKWHAMLWGWPAFPPYREERPPVDWVDPDDLSPAAYRMLVNNRYVEPLSEAVLEKLKERFRPETDWHSGWRLEAQGLMKKIDRPLNEVLADPAFFSKVLKPMATVLDELCCGLSEAMTLESCDETDALIRQLVFRGRNEEGLAELRRPPRPRKVEDAWERFQVYSASRDLFEQLYEAVLARSREREPSADWWRKGFGYAWSLGGRWHDANCTCRILPGLYVGPGGVVEAQGVMLKRPLDPHSNQQYLMARSQSLWELARAIEEVFPVHASYQPRNEIEH